MQNQILRRTIEAEKNGQVLSNEGGMVFQVDPLTHVRRFLILGSTSTFYTGAFKVTADATEALDRAIKEDASAVLDLVILVHAGNLALKKDPLLYALARLTLPNVPLQVRKDAAALVQYAAKTGTDLLHWISYRRGMGKSNRVFRRAIQQWFLGRSPEDLALQAVKYEQRDGWSLRDALRLARPKAPDEDYATVFDWIAHPDKRMVAHLVPGMPENMNRLFSSYRYIRAEGEDEAAEVISKARLPREAVPAPLLSRPDVWEALFHDMPARALLRNLGKLQSVGVLENYDAVESAVERIGKAAQVLHPFEFLIAGKVYRRGSGIKGNLSWTPGTKIANALDEGFGAAFPNIPVNEELRPLIALDVSGSMSFSAGGTVLTCMEAEAALAMVLKYQFPQAQFLAFAHELTALGIPGTYNEMVELIEGQFFSFGATYLDLPLEYAYRRGGIDAVVTITDSETHHRKVSPAEYVKMIHRGSPKFKHAVVAMAANGISVADPNDPMQLDFEGIDASLPIALGRFLEGGL